MGKGQTAPSQDLAKAFGPKTPLNNIILEILSKGELQVGEKERQAQLDRVHHEVIDIVAGKLVDPRTKRVYTTGLIEKALAELSTQSAHQQQQQSQSQSHHGPDAPASSTASTSTMPADASHSHSHGKGKSREVDNNSNSWTGVVTTRSAKSQALDAMKALIAHQPIPVARARMRLRVTCPIHLIKQTVKKAPLPSKSGTAASKDDEDDEDDEDDSGKQTKNTITNVTVKDHILACIESVESQNGGGVDEGDDEWEIVGFVEPGAFKGLGELIRAHTKGRGRVEVLDMAVIHEGD